MRGISRRLHAKMHSKWYRAELQRIGMEEATWVCWLMGKRVAYRLGLLVWKVGKKSYEIAARNCAGRIKNRDLADFYLFF